MSTFVLEQNVGQRYKAVKYFKSTPGAEVFTATDRVTNASVLIKVVNSARYFRESNVFALRRRCNLVIPEDAYFFDSDHCALVYPWIEGGDLRRRLRKGGVLSEEEVTRLAADLLVALDELHSGGLIHGDLKPENVLAVSCDGRPSFYLSDFGSCAPLGEVRSTAWRAGSPAYEAPESVLGYKSTESDLYSLGILLLEALRGEVPYKGMPKEIFRQAKWELPDLSAIQSNSLRQLIVLLIQNDVETRLQSAADGRRLLRSGIERIPPVMPRKARRLPQNLVVRQLGMAGEACRMIASNTDGTCIAFVGNRVVSVYDQVGKHLTSNPWCNAPPVWLGRTLWICQGADIYTIHSESRKLEYRFHLRYPPGVFSVSRNHLFWVSKGLLGVIKLSDGEPRLRAVTSYVQRKVLAADCNQAITTKGSVGNQLVCYDHELSQVWSLKFDGVISDVSIGINGTVQVVVFQFGARNRFCFYILKDGMVAAESSVPADLTNYGLMSNGCLVWRREQKLTLLRNTGTSIVTQSSTGSRVASASMRVSGIVGSSIQDGAKEGNL